MKSLLLIVSTIIFVGSAYGQTEEDVLSYARSGMADVKAGQITLLDFYRELYRRINATPSDSYRSKAEDLRITGQRIDILEDAQAGRITNEKAARMIAEQQADLEAAARQQADSQAEAQRRAAAEDDARRRAMALRLLQGGAFRPYQAQPYQMPTPRVCNSQVVGNQVQTVCN